MIADLRADKEQLNEKVREKGELIKQGDKQMTDAKEEINKLRAETADAVEGRRKARKEAMRLKAEQTEAHAARQTAEIEAKEAKEKYETAQRDLDKARDELKQIEVETAKANAQVTASHREELEELVREHDRVAQQKEAQLEYAEDMVRAQRLLSVACRVADQLCCLHASQLSRVEAKENARKVKTAGAQQRIDDEVRAAYEKLRTKTDEVDALKKELDMWKAKAKAAESLKQGARREQREHEERYQQALSKAEAAKKESARRQQNAERSAEKAQRVADQANAALQKTRDQSQKPDGPAFPEAAGSALSAPTSAGLSSAQMEQLARAIASELSQQTQ